VPYGRYEAVLLPVVWVVVVVVVVGLHSLMYIHTLPGHTKSFLLQCCGTCWVAE